jgi:hypothetical protein
MLVTPAGVSHAHSPTEVKVTVVKPPLCELVGDEQAGKVGVPVVEDVAAPFPTEFTARI